MYKIRQKFRDGCQLDCDAKIRLTNDGIFRYFVVVGIVDVSLCPLSLP